MQIEEFKELVEGSLLPNIDLIADSPFDPIIVRNDSTSWKLLGNGNYAAVFVHHSKPEWVVKVYGRNHEELKKEIQVYQKLGHHPSYSFLYGYGKNYLILKRIEGITLFNALIQGVPIPVTVIKDIDRALRDAKAKGLNPYDVHGKNVAMSGGRGYIVDISDFYKTGYCSKWDDLKKAYYRIYKPLILKLHPPFPFVIVDSIRKGYRFYKKVKRKRYC
ncbi:serine/threonine protein kinase [Peribacillus deserti]|uniref:Serine/threonine protein kinase n=1 Tax=Peribacillus deserti TaxID=673318 RepID=A0A2N5M3T0_9BACI|nr:serine/threonine protein kinase [Peribacillus deserti]PLT28985.1 serine/threonine protein kinase [Peribacillus deserti]